jgi:hypothetical protein
MVAQQGVPKQINSENTQAIQRLAKRNIGNEKKELKIQKTATRLKGLKKKKTSKIFS